MTKTFFKKLNDIQPSQLYISSDKLSSVMEGFPFDPSSVEPIPLKKLRGEIIFVDGHTRAFAAFQIGFSKVPAYWEYEELDWEAYEICVNWCKEEGIHTIVDLENRVIPHQEYEILWYDRCAKMQEQLKAKRCARERLINRE